MRRVNSIISEVVFKYLPIAISICALYLTFVDHTAREEDLHVDFMPVLENYETEMVSRSSGIDGPFFIDIKYRCKVFNNSDRPMSLSTYSLFTPMQGGYGAYTNMNQGLWDKDGNKVDFPINLAPGEGKQFTQVVGLNTKKYQYCIMLITKKENLNCLI